MRYRKRPDYVDAAVWTGPVPGVPFLMEVLPGTDPSQVCRGCGCRMDKHGMAESMVSGSLVCPGSWVITRQVDGGGVVRVSMDSAVFNALYEPCDNPTDMRDSPPNPQAASQDLGADDQKSAIDARLWMCPNCHERCNPLVPEWKFNGSSWEHAHLDGTFKASRITKSSSRS